MTKKALILTLALAFLLTSGALAVDFDTANGYPVVKEPVTFNILARQHMFHVDWSEMDLWKDYEELTGVHVEWTLVPTESFTEKRNLLMAANELPDAIMIAGLTNEQLIQYGEDGLLADFTELLEYMPNLCAAMEKYPQVKAGITMPNGAIYGLPGIFDGEFKSLIVGGGLYIQKAYLENLNMETPATVDEFTEFLRAVVEQDADGDGDPTNEVGYVNPLASGTGTINDAVSRLYGAYGLGTLGTNKHSYLQLNEDGTLSFLPATDRYKEVLQKVHEWYEMGAFSADVLTQDNTETYAICAANRAAVAATLSATNFTTNPEDYIGIEALEGPYGDKMICWQNMNLANVGTFVITTDCKEPELLASWIDWFYSEAGSIKFFMGTEGETFDIIDGEYVYQDWITHDPEGRSMDELIGTFSAYPGGGAPRIVTEKFFSGTQKQPDAMALGELNYSHLAPNAAPSFTYTLEESRKLTDLSDLLTYVDNMRIQFVTGSESFDNWDAYIEQLGKLKMEEYLGIESAAYARYLEAL